VGSLSGARDLAVARGFDVMRPTRAHVVYEGPRVLILIAQALERRAAA
jgi:hypothetical protein